MNILLLEDDKILAETIQDTLIDEGFSCTITLTGDAALEASYENKFDLYLLDINVPGILGSNLLSELRQSGDMTPAIFITSLSDNDSIVKGYENGCDDYIRKPFTLSELRVRIYAIFKRVYGIKENMVQITKNIFFNINTLEIFDGLKTTQLSKKEGNLLCFFIKNHGSIVSKDQIIDYVWKDTFPSDVVVRVHISAIKKIIGAEAITTIKGVGYKLEKI